MLVPRERLENKLRSLGFAQAETRFGVRSFVRGEERIQLNADDGFIAPTAAVYYLRRAGCNEQVIREFIRAATT